MFKILYCAQGLVYDAAEGLLQSITVKDLLAERDGIVGRDQRIKIGLTVMNVMKQYNVSVTDQILL